MGTQVSKLTSLNIVSPTTGKAVKANRASATSCSTNNHSTNNSNSTTTNSSCRTTAQQRCSLPIPTAAPVINLQIEESPTSPNANAQLSLSSSSSLTSVNNNGQRQIIIKIQLAKMENGGGGGTNGNDAAQQHQVQDYVEAYAADANSNHAQREAANTPILNLTLNGNFNGATARCSSATGADCGSSAALMARMSGLQIHGQDLTAWNQSASDAAEYCEVLEEAASCSGRQTQTRNTSLDDEQHVCASSAGDNNNCVQRRQKPKANAVQASTKRRSARDTLRRMLDGSSSSKSSKNKERKESKTPQKHSNHSEPNTVFPPAGVLRQSQATAQQQQQRPQPLAPPPPQRSSQCNAAAAAMYNPAPTTSSNHLSLWSPPPSSGSDVIIPINSPHLVVVYPPATSLMTLGRFDDNAIRLMTTAGLVSNVNDGTHFNTATSVNANISANLLVKNALSGPIVHSQVDFVHFLVPDLREIFNSSFYWGKMDRYEAERLLEGKPEGTFLLRDSAQEEFLFSVTFRKYGRSLHARIEQSGHKFSFDCHDPGVFTASTVTGLLEHYKNPADVMFFEPMLTIPFHRREAFSLQKLCRGTIVSNTTYDGINELELPTRLKAYLKSYHYKQKLRMKPLDDAFFTCT